MARVTFTSHLEKFVDCPPQDVSAATVREALDSVFSDNPRLRGYVLDDQSALRKHIVAFIDGKLISDRERLSDPIGPSSKIYVLQALSGG